MLQLETKCENCNEKMTRGRLNDHLDICIGKKSTCEKCLKFDRLKKHKCEYYFCKECESFYINEENHKITCDKLDVKCEFCSKMYKLENKNEHLLVECKFYPVNCQFCKEYIIRHKMISHYINCSKFKVTCKTCNSKYLSKEGHQCRKTEIINDNDNDNDSDNDNDPYNYDYANLGMTNEAMWGEGTGDIVMGSWSI